MKIKYLLILVIFALASFNAHATLVKALNLHQLTHFSKSIVRAKVVDKSLAEDPYESGKIVVYYTLAVSDWLKGGNLDQKNPESIIIKQLAGANDLGLRSARGLELPRYKVGEEYLFFLPEPHPKTGLLAPMGLEQGVFKILKTSQGDFLQGFAARKKFLTSGVKNKQSPQLALFFKKVNESKDDYLSVKNLILENVK